MNRFRPGGSMFCCGAAAPPCRWFLRSSSISVPVCVDTEGVVPHADQRE